MWFVVGVTFLWVFCCVVTCCVLRDLWVCIKFDDFLNCGFVYWITAIKCVVVKVALFYEDSGCYVLMFSRVFWVLLVGTWIVNVLCCFRLRDVHFVLS